MNNLKGMVLGILLIIVGVLFGLNALNLTDINFFFDGWWTLLIIVPCFIDLFKDKDKTGNIIGILVGVILLLGCQEIISFDLIWKLAFPIILVIIGISMVFKNVFKHDKKLTQKSEKEYWATFSGQNLEFNGEKFDGCELNAVFGGIKCDLRGADIKEDVTIKASSIFGGITIFVPKDMKVKVSSSSLFGGVSNYSSKKANKENVKTLYVNAECVFGGVEIK